MSLKSTVAHFFSSHLVEPFVVKPGLHVAADAAAERLTVEGGLAADHWSETFVQRNGGTVLAEKTGKVLDMTPEVKGGFQAGDIVLRGNSVFTTAESGWLSSLTESLRTGKWHIQKSSVSHAAVIVADPTRAGELRVVQMVSGDTPKDLAGLLTPLQKKLKATFLRNDSIHDFFNVPGRPITDAVVMRPKDPALAAAGAKRALALYQSQVTTQAGKTVTHPWFSKLPHNLAPDDRGGVCSTFVNLAFGDHFRQPDHIPVTPEHFELAPDVEKVGETRIRQIVAVKPSEVAAPKA